VSQPVDTIAAWRGGGNPAKLYEFEGQKLTLRQIAYKAGLSVEMLRGRLRRGLTMAQAVSEPPKKNYW
jgi:hypothetical protein